MRPRNPRAEDASLQRFFQRALTVRGEFFCCVWNVACCLDTIEHMDGDKYWRSVCSLGMSASAVLSALLIMLACSADYSWSRISEGVVIARSQRTIYSSSESSSNDTSAADSSSGTSGSSSSNQTNSDVSSDNENLNDLNALWHHGNSDVMNDTNEDNSGESGDTNDNSDDDSSNDDNGHNGHISAQDSQENLIVQDEVVTHRRIELNLWHVRLCSANYTNESMYRNETKVISAQTEGSSNDVASVSVWSRINGTSTKISNKTCRTRDNYEHKLDHSESINVARQFCIFFMISGLALQLMAAVSIAMTHPWFDRLHNWDVGLKSITSRMLGFSVVCMCACVLCWTSFVFARVLQTESDNFEVKWQNQTNFNTGMASLNAALLVTIVLSVVHCASPLRKIEDRYRRRRGGSNNNHNRHHRPGAAAAGSGPRSRRRRRRGSSVGSISISSRRMREMQRRRQRRHSSDLYYSHSSQSRRRGRQRGTRSASSSSSFSSMMIPSDSAILPRNSDRNRNSRERDRYYSLAGHQSAVDSLEFENRMWRRRRRRSRGVSWDPHRRRYSASLAASSRHRSSSSSMSHNGDEVDAPMVAMVDMSSHHRSREIQNNDEDRRGVSDEDLTRIRQGLVSLGLDSDMVSDGELIMQQRLLDRYAAQNAARSPRNAEEVTDEHVELSVE